MHPSVLFFTTLGLVACGNNASDSDTAPTGGGGAGATGGGAGAGGTSCTHSLLADGLGAPLFSIAATGPEDVWVVGAKDQAGPQAYHYDGAAWSRADLAGINEDLWWVHDDGGGMLRIGAEHGTIVSVDKATGTVTTEVIADSAYIFFGVWGSSPTDIWAVAGDPSLDLPGAIYHYDGTAWTLSAEATPTMTGIARGAFKVWGRSADDVYVVGTGALSMHWDGASWETQASPLYEGVTLFTVSGDASSTIAVGGQGNAAAQMWAGYGVISDITPPPTALAPGFIGVYDHPDHDPVATAATGAIWRYSGGSWEPDACAPATSYGLHAAWVDDDGGIWAAGGDLNSLNYGVMVYSGDRDVPQFP